MVKIKSNIPAFLPYRMFFLFMIILLVLNPKLTHSNSYKIHENVETYVLEKLKSNDIVFLGTTHKKSAILKFIGDLIPHLKDAGVTHVGLEIPTDQQGKIDTYMTTGTGLMEIYVHSQIDCPEYRNMLAAIHRLNPQQRFSVVALDLPKSMYKQGISRNEWIAQTIAAEITRNPHTKMLVVVGNFHLFKKIVWQDHVPNKTGSIREYLKGMVPDLKAFSIGQLIDENPDECDFTKEFGPIEGSVAFDSDERFKGWKLGLTSVIAIKKTEPCQLFDGLIVY